MTELAKYTGISPAKIDEMNRYTPTIKELLDFKKNEPALKKTLYVIIMKYLNAYDIDKVKITDTGVEILIERIMNDHGNLEMQEIEYLLKKGIVGAYGAIYGDLRIDTVYSWFDKYKSNERPNRPEPDVIEKKPEYTGTEMTVEQYFEKYPDKKEKSELLEIVLAAKTGKMTMDLLKQYYKIKKCTLDDLKDDMAYYSGCYYKEPEYYQQSVTEHQYLMNCLSQWVLKSYDKQIV